MAMNPRLLVPRASGDPDALRYISAVQQADGQALEPAIRKAIADFIVGSKADGIWDAIKASCILMGARTLAGALVPLKGTAPTNFNNNFVGGDYVRKTGLKGNGSNKYLDSNRANNADPQNSNHNAAYVSEAGTDGILIASGFITSGDNALFGSGGARNRNNAIINPPSQVQRTGFLGHSRSVVAEFEIRYDGATVGSGSLTSAPPDANNLFIFRRNADSAAYYDGRIAFYSIGESLNLASLDTRVSSLFTAIGNAIP